MKLRACIEGVILYSNKEITMVTQEFIYFEGGSTYNRVTLEIKALDGCIISTAQKDELPENFSPPSI